MTAVWGAKYSHGFAGAGTHTVPTPTGTGGVLVVIALVSDSAGTYAPFTPADWTLLIERHQGNALYAWVTDVASPDMSFTKTADGSSAVLQAVRVPNGTLTGVVGAQGDGGWWDEAQRTQTLPSVTAPANAVGLGFIIGDNDTASFTWSTMTEVDDATTPQAHAFAQQLDIPAGTWNPGTVTSSNASYFNYGVVAVGTTAPTGFSGGSSATVDTLAVGAGLAFDLAAKATSLSDDFSAPNSLWTGITAPVDISTGVLRIPYSTTFRKVRTVDRYDLRDSSVTFRLHHNNGAGNRTIIRFGDDDNRVELQLTATVGQTQQRINGVDSGIASIGTFFPNTMRWYRFAQSGTGNVLLQEASHRNATSWTTRRVYSVPWVPHRGYLEFEAGNTTSDNSANHAYIDHVNIGGVSASPYVAFVNTPAVGTTTAITPNFQTPQAGDLLLAHCIRRHANAILPPANEGWTETEAGGVASRSSPVVHGDTIFAKIWGRPGVTDDSTPTFTTATNTAGWGVVPIIVRNPVNATAPWTSVADAIKAAVVDLDDPAATTMVAPDATDTGIDRLVMRVYSSADDNNHTVPNYVGANGYSGSSYHTTVGDDFAESMSWDNELTLTGSTGTSTSTQSVNGPDIYISRTLVIGRAPTGTLPFQGGSRTGNNTTAAGGGTAGLALSGGSSAAVNVVTTGDGASRVTSQGGSSTAVDTSAAGDGTAVLTASGGSTTPVTVTAAGDGTSLLAASGGSATTITTSSVGGGTSGTTAEGGSDTVVAITATGTGTAQERAPPEGSSTEVTVTAAGEGDSTVAAAEGSATTVAVLSAGSGRFEQREAFTGGSPTAVAVTADGAGTGAVQGSEGSATAVAVSAAGDGVAVMQEAPQGGSGTAVTVSPVGVGSARLDAGEGSATAVAVVADGAGTAEMREAAQGGSGTAVATSTAGTGSAREDARAGAGTAVATSAVGGGSARLAVLAGSWTVVAVVAVGAGYRPETRDLSGGGITTIDHGPTGTTSMSPPLSGITTLDEPMGGTTSWRN